MPELSIIIPAWNEVASLPDLVRAITEAFPPGCEPSIELVVVDDGSDDGSWELLSGPLRAAEPRLVPGRLPHRGGQTAALWAGLGWARADWVAHLDADLQNDPRDLRALWALGKRGFDAVLGYRERRQDSWSRRLVSCCARRARQAMLGDPIVDIGCSTRVVRREALRHLPPLTNAHRYLPAMLFLLGFRVIQVPVDHRARRFGHSKYTTAGRTLEALRDIWGVRAFLRAQAPAIAWSKPPAGRPASAEGG